MYFVKLKTQKKILTPKFSTLYNSVVNCQPANGKSENYYVRFIEAIV